MSIMSELLLASRRPLQAMMIEYCTRQEYC